jgi:hypothetical protein
MQTLEGSVLAHALDWYSARNGMPAPAQSLAPARWTLPGRRGLKRVIEADRDLGDGLPIDRPTQFRIKVTADG